MQDDFDTLSRILDSRYSCRGYLKKEVEEADIREIVAAASRVPTWCNAQPWQVIVTRGSGTEDFAEVLTKAAETTEMEPDFASTRTGGVSAAINYMPLWALSAATTEPAATR
jgi:nitroreductase